MDHERRSDRERDRKEPVSEGVRIIGAEEAAEAIQRGEVAPRRGDDQPRYGDRPSPPTPDGPRPVLRFPLGSSSDPTDISRPPVAEPISEPVELPHWTQPPTGQVPQILPDQRPAEREDLEDWASFATSSPRWRDDEAAGGYDDPWASDERLGALDDRERPSHDDFFSFADLDEPVVPGRSVFAEVDEPPAYDEVEDEPWEERPDFLDEPATYEDSGSHRIVTGQRLGRAGGSHRAPRGIGGGGGGGAGSLDRDLGQAAVVGAGLLVLAAILFKIGPVAAMALVVGVIGLAVAELYSALRQAGYHPLSLVGIAGTVGLVIGGYNNGYEAVPVVLFLTTVVCLLWYLFGAATESPVLNIGVTLFGALWVGMFGAFAAFMLSVQDIGGQDPGIGILMAAILGTVGYDVGGLFVGRNAGRSPLSPASPNKTWEGLLGGCAVAFVIVLLLSASVGLGSIDEVSEGFLVGLAIALAAPLGDLSQSLVKRDLGVKDMGTILPGHGGLLDRFDGLLFVLPAVWLVAVWQDWFLV
jgi:phosphatidate cytidylyltransferase